jgi:LPS-assembly lipoprotein
MSSSELIRRDIGGDVGRRAVLRLLAGSAVLLAAGCGFHPLYAEQNDGRSVGPKLTSVRVSQIPERIGQVMTTSLRDGLSPTGTAAGSMRYQLDVALTESRAALALRKDDTSSRTRLVVLASFVLRDLTKNSTPVLTGTARFDTSFDVTDSEYATIVTEQTALERAARDLAGDIQNRVAIYLQRQA